MQALGRLLYVGRDDHQGARSRPRGSRGVQSARLLHAPGEDRRRNAVVKGKPFGYARLVAGPARAHDCRERLVEDPAVCIELLELRDEL